MKAFDSSSPAAPPSTDSDLLAFRASFAQQRLWFLDQFEPGTALYNIPGALRLRGPLDYGALSQALDRIVERHEALRTTFRLSGGELMQSIAPPRRLPLPVTDLSAAAATAGGGEEAAAAWIEAEARRLAREEAVRPFDLAAGPLLRARLLRLGEADHLLVLTMHHIVSDGWSLSIFYRELGAFYAAALRGRETVLEELPIQYADYAEWQRERLGEEVLAAEMEYWRGRLRGGALPVLELPRRRGGRVGGVEGAAGGGGASAGACETRVLGRQTRERLAEASRREGVTLFMLLLAGWQVLLWRYTGERLVTVGTPIANRTRAEVEGLIGYFVNTLVLVGEVEWGKTFAELLREVREETLGAYAHQEMPFEKVVEALAPERGVSHSPLFQVMFVLQNTPKVTLNLPGLEAEPIPLDNGLAKSDLSLSVSEDDEGLTLRADYKSELFDAEMVGGLLRHYKVLLAAAAADPRTRVGELPLLTEQERRKILSEWNDTRGDYPRGELLHKSFERQAALTPNALAVLYGGLSLTYAELEARANRLARYLRGEGVGVESLVGVMLGRSPEVLVAILAVLKAGGAYVPLDPQYPAQRLNLMLEDAGIELLLTERPLAGKLSPTHARLVYLDEGRQAVEAQPPAPFECAATAENLAYVIYTSGSTGRPKGVMITHRAVVNFLRAMRERPGLAVGDVLLAVTTLSFDIAGLELYLPLSVGARVVLASREAAADAAQLLRLIADEGVTVMQATPATWRMMLDSGWRGGEGLKVLCGGEALPRDLADGLSERSAEVWNLFGPTETTIWSTAERVLDEAGPVSIGRPIANTEVYVLDEHMSPVPVGVAGELYIGGDGVARGYLRRPALTAERFVPDPFSDEPGGRLYRCGDRARFLDDGRLEFLGRADEQLKVRGFRVEPGEVEAALRQHTAVREAAVSAAGEGAARLLVAYVAAAQGLGAEQLRRHLRELVPDYMVPSAFVFLEALPLTPNGKVDRRALAALGWEQEREASAPEEEREATEVEERVAGIWREVLGRERVGLRENFFELGGHSLLATRVVSRVRESFGVEVAVRRMFEAPTVEALAREVEEARAKGESGARPITRASREGRRISLPTAGEE